MPIPTNMIASSQRSTVHGQSHPYKLGAFASYFVVFVLAFMSLRGWVVLNLNAPTEVVYGFSSVLLVALAMYGFNCRFRIKNRSLTLLRNLLMVNLLMGAYYAIGAKLLGGTIDISILNLYILPYIVFLFLRISAKKLHMGLFLIFAGISFSVIDNFMISLTGIDGLGYLEEYNTKLRPLVFEAMSRTGDYFRVGGYTGSHHDSANILGMLGLYYYVNFLNNRSWLTLIIAMIALTAMTFTQSAANIVFALFTCFMFTIYIAVKKPTVGTSILLFVIAVIVLFIASIFPEVFVFADRLGSEGDWDGMRNKLSIDVLFTPYFWVGYGNTAGSEYIHTEIAFLKGILEMGLVPACLFYWILICPVYIFVKNKSQPIAALPYLAAIVFGFLSLGHYGSLFRSTNIAIFYAMYALFFISIIADKERQLKVH